MRREEGREGEPQNASIHPLSFASVCSEHVTPDAAVSRFVDHEDAVCGLAWSACNAWVVGHVSYSGRVSFVQVPAAEKYKILL